MVHSEFLLQHFFSCGQALAETMHVLRLVSASFCPDPSFAVLNSRSVCSLEPGSTGLASWTGYLGPFKAREDSVDMTCREGECMEGQLWNYWPSYGHEEGSYGA